MTHPTQKGQIVRVYEDSELEFVVHSFMDLKQNALHDTLENAKSITPNESFMDIQVNWTHKKNGEKLPFLGSALVRDCKVIK